MKAIPAGVEIQIEIRLVRGEEVLAGGMLLIGDEEEAKDFQLAGIAAQRGVYELFQTLCQQLQSNGQSAVDKPH